MTANWGHGYNIEQGYTYGFYREMTPQWLDYAVRLSGGQPPSGAGLRYLELGCGQGMNLLVMAAAYPDIEFVGVDFHPLHIAHASRLAVAAGLENVSFREEDFADLSQSWPADLGRFDYVTMHGIYTWITPELRAAVVRCLDHATRPGALVYNGYNTMPGWLNGVPLQHLLRAQQLDAGLSPKSAIQVGYELVRRLQSADARIFGALRGLDKRVERLFQVDSSYAVQEFLHDDNWHPLWHSQVAKELAVAKLAHVGTATLTECYLPELLPTEKQAVISTARGSAFRQDLIDCMVNQVFRRDVFQRGAIPLWSGAARAEQLSQNFILVAEPSDEVIAVQTIYGVVNLKREITAAVVQRLVQGIASFREIVELPELRNVDAAAIHQAMTFLIHSGHVLPYRDAGADVTIRFNRAIASEVARGAPYDMVACSQTGSGANASKVDLLLLDCLVEAETEQLESLAEGLLHRVRHLGMKFTKEDASVSDQEMRGEAENQVRRFMQQTLPGWRRLGAWR